MNRPGNIENVYENKKTLEYGKIISYNDEYSTLVIQLSDGKTKSMRYSTFKGIWRKKAQTKLEPVPKPKAKKKRPTRKYMCPNCEIKLYPTRDCNAMCMDCNEMFERV